MPSIDLYYMPESPPCRTVEMVAQMVGVTLNKHYINLFTKENLTDEYAHLNPRRKVPFIVDGELKLTESRAIAKYLVSKYKPDDPYLYPKDIVERAHIDEMLDFELGTLYQAAYKALSPMFYGPVEELDKDAEDGYKHVLHYLDRKLGENGAKRFLFGNHLTIADLSFAATFSLPEACEYNLHDFKHVFAYLDRLKAAIPRYGEINDEPVENMRKFIKAKQEGK